MSATTLFRGMTATGAALLLAVAGATTASAAAEPTPRVSTGVDGDQVTVTVTTDLAAAKAACARLDTTREHLRQLVGRIDGDAGTAGSAAWLRERAQRAEQAGHDDQASRLTDRADRRAGWLDDLQSAIDRLDRADASVCAALPEAGE